MADSAGGLSKGCEREGHGKNSVKITHTHGKRGNNDGPKRTNLNDFKGSKRELHAKLKLEIAYVSQNKCPTVESAYWKKALKDLKKSMLDDLAVSES
ncbi:hypothetical protein D8674_030965 [Pyrus ussuriensis x Pyrus communis]|uniref:Uncharacterized protein n=1 Tax=Pyrus ussuriensis x Pyrus communis TaxID=2448454 RepID=A0A5N5EXQ9_9ROSA|nr:hypothetical protein D8674_030965 [Pyrus ussuriensis x Pyrus communis]